MLRASRRSRFYSRGHVGGRLFCIRAPPPQKKKRGNVFLIFFLSYRTLQIYFLNRVLTSEAISNRFHFQFPGISTGCRSSIFSTRFKHFFIFVIDFYLEKSITFFLGYSHSISVWHHLHHHPSLLPIEKYRFLSIQHRIHLTSVKTSILYG